MVGRDMRWCFVVFLLLSVSLFPQTKKSEMSEMRIIGMAEFHPEELIDYDVKDANGDVAAGLIIETDLVGLAYDANLGMVKMNHLPGRDFLFLQYKEREVKILLSGYAPLQVILKNYGIKLERGKSWLLKLTADKKSEIIAVTFLVQPSGAQLKVDGDIKEKMESIPLSTGEHEIQITKPGYETVIQKITVSLENSFYKYSLNEVQDEKIFISSKPAGAKIEIDGAAKGETDRDIFVPSGRHKLSLIKADHLRLDTVVSVTAGGKNRYSYNLIRNIAVLNISAVPADAEILIDNLTAHTGVNEILPGEHTYIVSKTGYGSEESNINLSVGDNVRRTIELKRIDGTITVTALPVDAQIQINGKAYQGGVVRVEPGENTITASKQGYCAVEEKLDIKAGDDIIKTVTLTKNLAYIDISANPLDSKIMIDNNGAKTGTNEVTPGIHNLSASKIGYAKEVKQVTLLLGQKTSERFVLKRIDGTITLSSIPGDAQIKINGKTYRSGEMRVEPGMYEMTVTKPGYLSLSEKIEIKAGDDINKEISLTKNSAYINLTINPTDAEILLNGRKIFAVRTEVTPGSYKLEIIKDGYLSAQDTFSLAIGQEKKKTYALTKNSGTVNFTLTPSNAVITINNSRYNEQNIELTPGTYKAVISAEGCREKSESFTIERGKTKSITVNLEQITGKLEISLNVPEAQCELYKNGKLIEQWIGSKQFAKLQIGEYETVIKAKGYKTNREKVNITELEKTAKSIELKAGSDVPNNMVFVKGGTFKMGSNEYDSEKPIHTVTVGDFYIGKYEVTQKEWESVMESNPSNFKGANRPVEQVSWTDIQEFLQKLNFKTGKNYRLPTEAEWEYAARGGNQSKGYKYSGSNSIDKVAWYDGNSSSQTHEVGQNQPNELGIYDMSGNVWECCSDWYAENYYKSSPSKNPQGPSSGSTRVLHGGSWVNNNLNCRSSDRFRSYPTGFFSNSGFRLASTN